MSSLLTSTEIARVRVEHPVVDVLARAGIGPPARWDGSSDYMISCPCPGHRDSTPSCIVHPQTDRWHCFGCGAHGDVLELVRHVEGVTSLRSIAEILDSRRPLHSLPGGVPPAAAVAGATVPASERPDQARTSYERVMAVNATAWRYLSLPKLAARGRDYLHSRGIDVGALEAETGRPVIGHTPYQPDGLVIHLRSRGFSDDEIVDAGWGSRRDDRPVIDRFRRRVIIPVRDAHGRVIGVYGRDLTGSASQKYLNTAETVAFHKGSAVYRPAISELDEHATVIACEGSLDALAIASHAAHAGKSHYFAPVSPSGTALTETQAGLVLAISDRPPLVCADGDEPGRTASVKWVRTLMGHGRETVVTVLPDGHDPASWLRQHGTAGLCAFTRKGCLDLPADAVKPAPAGGLLAECIMTELIAAARRRDPDAETVLALPAVLRRLAVEAAKVPGEAAANRFADAAGDSLARLVDGMDAGARARQVFAAICQHRGFSAVVPQPQADKCVSR